MSICYESDACNKDRDDNYSEGARGETNDKA